MTNELKWRLQELPTGGEIADLVSQEVITKEEARQILFSKPSKESDSEVIKTLKAEINFLRELTERLANKSYVGINTWQPYTGYPWYRYYNTAVNLVSNGTGLQNMSNLVMKANTNQLASAVSNTVLTTTGTTGSLALPRYEVK